MFELLRKDSADHGLAIGIKENFKPCLITEGDDDNEILTVEATVSDKNIRFITGYCPQEIDNVQRRQNFFSKLNEEICSAQLAGKSIFIELDANSKLGSKIIPGDPCEKISENGKLLLILLEKHENLILLNKSPKCRGVITRSLKVNGKI